MDLSLRFGKAIQFVLDAHKVHLRKGTETPYVSHLLAVASIVLDYGGGEDEAIAALLHDVVEDRGVEVGEIRKQFGNKAAEIVAACSDSFEKNPENKPDWRVRKEAYLKHLKMAASDVLLVSAADKLHNVRSIVKDFREIGNKVWERFNGGKDGTLWYYTSLVKTLRASGEHKMLVEEFARCVSTLEGIISSTQSNQL